MLDTLIGGQMLPTGSPIHRLDPRTRILGFLALMTLFLVVNAPLPALPALAATAGLVLVARIPPAFAVRSITRFLPWLALIALLQLAFGVGNEPGCPPLLVWGPLRVSACTLRFALLTMLRFTGFVLLMNLFMWTTSIPSLVRGIEALVRPLDRIGLPAHQLAMVGVIAVRFLPTMALEMMRLQKAQAARGADVRTGQVRFLGYVRRTLPLIVPLFIQALRRAERLAEAMEARAYGLNRHRGSYANLHFRPADGIALAVVVLFVTLIVLL
jgi:energy-coupling factor transport system permease protein